MVIDSSALIAILEQEPEADLFTALIDADPVRMVSAVTFVEAAHVIFRRRGEAGLYDLRSALATASISLEPFTSEQVESALFALRRYGKGRHPARLNLGDCFSYALAKSTGEPLLFKGDDFARTDIATAA